MGSASSSSSSNAFSVVQLLSISRIRSNRAVSLSSVRACHDRPHGPSCIYVGPLHTASKETLEALYSQARDAYYSGEPLIVDDMFDRVELKLKWYGSKSVVKYPRCSIRRHSTYADADVIFFTNSPPLAQLLSFGFNMFLYSVKSALESYIIDVDVGQEDLSMAFALASLWSLFLALGCSACVWPILYTVSTAYQKAFDSGLSYGSQASGLGPPFVVNSIIFMALGLVIGYPVASASVKVLEGLWRNDLAALKGSCPNCGEEVFAFVRTDKANNSPHRADCHVCECLLEFRTKVEQSALRLGRQWVYGRIYLVRRSRRQKEFKKWIKPISVQFFLVQNSFVRTQKQCCNTFRKEVVDMSMGGHLISLI
ncbi:PGR5-like protein 1B, chloroplastic, partial [Mucuna pruriens]